MKYFIQIMIAAAVIVGCNPDSNQEKPNSTPPEPEVQVVDPTWPMPDGAAIIELGKSEVSKEAELIEGKVILKGLTLLMDTTLPKGFNEAVPLVITVKVENSEVAKFRDGLSSFEHTVIVKNIGSDGMYSFPIELIGYKTGPIALKLFWKWPVATEGCCSIALLAVLTGCNNNAACICTSLAAMAAPGSWCCKIHPLMFRYYWRFYACAGPSPY